MKSLIILPALLFLLLPTITTAQGEIINRGFGANIHLVQRYDPSLWDAVVTQASTDGVQIAREEFNWNVIEPVDNTFDFTAYDSAVQSYTDSGIDVMGLLTYSSSFAAASQFDAPSLTAWSDYVGTVAEHYAGDITYWEIWNEPNYTAFWTGSITDYAALITESAVAIKAANPDAKIVLGGLSGADADWLDQLYDELSDPSIIDVVAVHPYRVIGDSYTYSPETATNGLNNLVTDLGSVLAVMNRHDQTEPAIWLTEVGWPTDTAGVDEATQAEYLTRLYTLAFSVPRLEKVFWYNWSDDSSSFGLYNSDLTPKSAAGAFTFMQTYLTGSYFSEQSLIRSNTSISFGDSDWHFAGTQCTDGSLNRSNGVLTINYRFTGSNNCYGPVALEQRLPDNTKTLQFQAKGSDEDTQLRLRVIDKTGETFQYNLSYVPSTWMYYTIKLKQADSHWDGDNDGVLDQPLQLASLIADNTDGHKVSGSMQFKDLQTSDAPLTYQLKFKRSNGNRYAYWTTGNPRTRTLHTSAKRVNVLQRGQATTEQRSSTGKYRLRMTNEVSFIQGL